MAVCNFCSKEFSNAQAVRAHLKGCIAYRERNAKPTSTMPTHTAPRQPVPVREMPRQYPQFEPAASSLQTLQHRLEAAKLNLQLRELRAANVDLDNHAIRARNDAQKEAQQVQLKKKRREIIQRIKDIVIKATIQKVPNALRVEAIMAIEEELSTMKVEELPDSELVEIATSIRDHVYNPFFEEEETERKNFMQKVLLLSYGKNYARTRVNEEVESCDQVECLREIDTELEESLVGDESRSDVMHIVDSVLDSMFEYEDEDDIEY